MRQAGRKPRPIRKGVANMPTTINRQAYAFFREHAGGWVGHSAEVAANLARAEAAAQRMGWQYRWEWDDMPWDGDTPAPKELLGCVLTDDRGEVLDSLWGIGDPDRNSARVVEAE